VCEGRSEVRSGSKQERGGRGRLRRCAEVRRVHMSKRNESESSRNAYKVRNEGGTKSLVFCLSVVYMNTCKRKNTGTMEKHINGMYNKNGELGNTLE